MPFVLEAEHWKLFLNSQNVCVCVCVCVCIHYQVCAHSPLRISWAISGWHSHLCWPQEAGCRIRRYKGLHNATFFTCIDLFKKDFIQPDWRHTSAHSLLLGTHPWSGKRKWKMLSHVQLFAWNSPGQNTGVGNLSLPQGIFPTQGSNPGLLHCRQILYHLSYREDPYSY